MAEDANISINSLFPDAGKLLLTGGGKQFIERIGIDATKQAILNVMTGQNLRTQTEPLSQQRIAVLSGAIFTLFIRGFSETPDFGGSLSTLAVEQIRGAKRSDKNLMWVAQWLIGLTGKQFENVLRSDRTELERYIADFESAISKAAEKCSGDFGALQMRLTLDDGAAKHAVELDWTSVARLTTAISSQTLTIRGSEKSLYGKLFEKLILGSILTILEFERVDPESNSKSEGVFWLSDSSDLRESDASLLIKPNTFARFDLGFIGKGNPEISKDKLSRYAREFEARGKANSSVTFIIVDRLPEKSKRTEQAAAKIGAEIVQMSMGYWVKDLAGRLGKRFGLRHELQNMDESRIEEYLAEKLSRIRVEEFISRLTIKELVEEAEAESENANDDLAEGD